MRTVHLDAGELRAASLVLLGAAVVAPLLPVGIGLGCMLRAATGVPCPLCGTTTSVSEAVRLDVGGALSANPAGLLLVVAALAMLVLRPRRVRVPAALPYVALPAMWVFELGRFDLL
jgi:Protein of unknown function (DUF2752)